MRRARGSRPAADVVARSSQPKHLARRSASCCSPSAEPAVSVGDVALKVQVETADKVGVLPTKADGFVSRDIAGETIVVPVRGGVGDLNAIFTLNTVGATIWRLIDGATSLDGLASTVAAEYEVTPDDAARDVRAFVQLLTDKGLLVRAPEDAAAK